MRNFSKLLAVLFLLTSITVAAQTSQVDPLATSFAAQESISKTGVIRCSTEEYDLKLRSKYPSLPTRDELESLLAPKVAAYKALAAAGKAPTVVLTIPVVIHVIHNGEAIGTAPNITDTQVLSQITVMNEDFRKLAGTPGDGAGVDVEIEFCLAVVDPAGVPTTGINRVNLGQASWSTGDINGTVKPGTIWDPTRYMNMWSVNFTDATLLGYAQFPGGPANTDGVVANYSTFGSINLDDGTFLLNPPYNEGRTMTHEVGHWLNLFHIWGDTGACTNDDQCADTPDATGSNFGCPTVDSCPADGLGNDQVQNYMDYSDDSCMSMFTNDQKARMVATMTTATNRASLATSTVCSANYAIVFAPTQLEICNPDDAVYTFDYDAIGAFASTVNLSATIAPAGPTITLSQNSVNTDTTGMTLTVSGAAAGPYVITFTSDDAGTTEDILLDLTVYGATAPTGLTSPADTAVGVTSTTMTWNANPNATTYDIAIYSDPALTILIEQATALTTTSYVAGSLAGTTTYYWVVTANNAVCSTSSVSSSFSFTMANINPNCSAPSNLTATAITETSALLGWTENGTATSWDIEIVPAGTPPTGIATATALVNPYLATGLPSGQSYDFYVLSDCQNVGDGVSSWVGPFTFDTLICDFSTISVVTTTECLEYCFSPNGPQFGTFFDFNTGVLPNGWTASPYAVGQPCVTDMIDNSDYFWAQATNAAGIRQVTSNPVDVTLGGTIKFYMRYGSDDPDVGCEDPDEPDEGVFLQYSIDGGANWVNINTWVPTGVLTDPLYQWIEYTETIPAPAQTSTSLFRWFQPVNSGTDFDNWGLDNVLISANTNGNFVWDFGDGNTSTDQNPCHIFTTPGDYNISLSVNAPNCIASSSAILAVADTVLPIVNCQNITVTLDATGTAVITAADIDNGSTDNCGIDTMTLSQTVFTAADGGPNTVTLTVTDIYGNVSTCDATVTVPFSCGNVFTDTGGSTGQYQNNEDFSWVFAPNNPGDFVQLDFTMVNLETCCDNLAIYNGPDATFPVLDGDLENPATFTSTHSSGMLFVTFRSDSSVVRDGWVASIDCVTCPGVIDLLFTNITEVSADISWTETGGATEWEIEVVPVGTAPTGTGVTTTINPYSVTGLTSGTDYIVYIRSICSPTDSSSWTSSGFTTPAACGDVFTDTGGSTGQYQNNEDLTWAFSPSVPGTFVTIDFTMVNLETCCDNLAIYNGPDATFPVLDGDLENPATFTSTHSSGMLFVTFRSDSSVIRDGWLADIICPTVICPTVDISYVGSPFCDSLTAIQPVILTGTNGSNAIDVFTGGTYSATPAGLIINPLNGDITPNGSIANTYTVNYHLDATVNCPAIDATTQIVITALPAATINYATPFCDNLTALQAVTIIGTTGGVFSAPTGLIIDATSGAITPSGSTPGNYVVTYSFIAANGCAAVDFTTTVDISENPAVAISYAGTPFCTSITTGEPVTFDTATGASTGGVFAATPVGLTLDTATGEIIPSSSTPGTYNITYTTLVNGGCAAVTSAPTTVIITALPTITLFEYTGSPFCDSETALEPVTITGTNNFTGGTYSAVPNTGLIIDVNTGAITPNGSTPGSYVITYQIGAADGCAIVRAITTIVVDENPTVQISYSNSQFCTSSSLVESVIYDVATGAFAGGTFSVTPTIGLSIDTATGDIMPSASTPGIYDVVYTTPSTGGCPPVTSLVATVEISNSPVIQTLTPLYECDADNDNNGNTFDLHNAVTLAEVTYGNSYAVTFYSTDAAAQGGSVGNQLASPYNNLANPQIIYVRADLGTTGCFAISELELNILETPVLPVDPIIYTECDYYNDLTDGVILFDLVSYETILFGGATGLDATYYTALEPDGSVNLSTQLTPMEEVAFENYNDQVIHVLVTNQNQDSAGSYCTTQSTITLHVEIAPSVLLNPAGLIDIYECDDDTDTVLGFDLLSYYDQITTDDTSGLIISFYPTSDAVDLSAVPIVLVPSAVAIDDSVPYVVTSLDTILVSLLNPLTGCNMVALVTLHVNNLPTPNDQVDIDDDVDMRSCLNDGTGPGTLQEGYAIFDFTSFANLIDPQVGSTVALSYYTSEAEAIAGINAITDITSFYNTSPFDQRIWVRIQNDNVGKSCFVIRHIDLNVPAPSVSIDVDKATLCIDDNGVPLNSNALPMLTAINVGPDSPSDYSYEWMLNGIVIPGSTGQMISVSQAGDYTVTVTHIDDTSSPHDDLLCTNSATTTITSSSSPSDYQGTVTTDAFADSHQIVATATSSTNVVFIYILDGDASTANTTGIFNDVTPGAHTVTISDASACWSAIESVFVIDYPRFFTPNGDGINDYWAIFGQENIPISQIYIFDRFGKLLKQLDPDSLGWDGTYNGNPVPATDYWFKIIYVEGAVGSATQKEFTAHFSLKR